MMNVKVNLKFNLKLLSAPLSECESEIIVCPLSAESECESESESNFWTANVLDNGGGGSLGVANE